MTQNTWYEPDIERVVVTETQLRDKIEELAQQVATDYARHDSVLLVGVLKGAYVFMADFARALGRYSRPVEVEFMAISSYGQRATSSGVVRILKDLETPIEGKDVVIVEDVVDSGLTLGYLLRSLRSRNPRSLEVCALLVKPHRRKVELPIRYVGFEIPDRFVVGYGLDLDQRYRNLPYVAALADPQLPDKASPLASQARR